MNRAQRRRRRKPAPSGYPPVNTQTTAELWDRLVADGVRRTPTDLAWMVAAVQQIARAKRTTPEKVFVELDETVKARCGRGLTVEPGRL